MEEESSDSYVLQVVLPSTESDWFTSIKDQIEALEDVAVERLLEMGGQIHSLTKGTVASSSLVVVFISSLSVTRSAVRRMWRARTVLLGVISDLRTAGLTDMKVPSIPGRGGRGVERGGEDANSLFVSLFTVFKAEPFFI